MKRAKRSELFEALAELTRAIEAEHPRFYIRTPRGRVTVRSWDGAKNKYGEELREAWIQVEHSIAVEEALRRAHQLVDPEIEDSKIEGLAPDGWS